MYESLSVSLLLGDSPSPEHGKSMLRERSAVLDDIHLETVENSANLTFEVTRGVLRDHRTGPFLPIVADRRGLDAQAQVLTVPA